MDVLYCRPHLSSSSRSVLRADYLQSANPQNQSAGYRTLAIPRKYLQPFSTPPDLAFEVVFGVPFLSVYFFSSGFVSGFGVGSLKDSGLRSIPAPTCSQALDPPSKLRKACVISRGSVTMRFFSSS